MSSFGDAAAVSGRVNLELAEVLKSEVSDLVIAPSYDEDALRLLKTKRRGQYLILQIDPDYEPDAVESRDVFGLTLEQERNAQLITPELFAAADPNRGDDGSEVHTVQFSVRGLSGPGDRPRRWSAVANPLH
jgi:AICAR transformylase/IMP cyclohydrolase PurH